MTTTYEYQGLLAKLHAVKTSILGADAPKDEYLKSLYIYFDEYELSILQEADAIPGSYIEENY